MTAIADRSARKNAPHRSTARMRIARLSLGRRVASFALLVIFVAAWQLAAEHWIKPVWISSPSLVWHRLGQSINDGTLWRNTWATFEETILGLLLGVVAGVVVGIVLSNLNTAAKLLDPYLMGAYSLPRVALAPFFVLWFGIGLESKVLLVASIAFFPILFNVRQGMDSIDRDLVDVLRSMRAGPIPMLTQVIVPSVLPWIVSAIKIAIGMALIGAVVGEMVGADRGLGWLVSQSINNFDMTGAVMSLLIMAVIAMALHYIITALEKVLFRWRSESGSSSIVAM